jgi:predicted permease
MSDLRHALRLLMTQPGLTCPVVLALALGIGVNTTIFGFVDGLLFRPLSVERLDEVVRVTAVERAHPDDHFNSSYPVFTDYRDGAKSFAALAAYADDNAVHMSVGAGAPERLTGALVSGRFFEVLGTRAWRGRLLGPDDDRIAGRHPVAVISYGLWRRVFGGSDEAIGRTVRLNNHPFTIVGVTPPGVVGVSLDTLPDLWTPMAMAGQVMPEIAREFGVLNTRRFSWLNIVGRMKPGVTVAQAQAELDAIATHRAAAQPAQDRDPFAGVVPVEQLVTGTETGTQYKTMSWVLLGVVGLVLLIACADAAGLLLVRAEQRQREMAVRAAMGATRWRLVRQLLTESLLLAGVATLAGVLVALWSAEGLLAVLPSDFPLAPAARGPIGEPRVLLFTLASALVAALAFGLAPAWRASRPNLVPALKQDTPALGRARRLSLRHAFVVGQIALCVLLLVGAGLLLRTVRAFGAIAPGFETERMLVASVDVALQGYDEARGRRFFEDVNASIAALPGVAHAALGRMVPVDLSGMRVTFDVAGQPKADPTPTADFNPVTTGFFAALGIPIVQGRDFATADNPAAPQVVIVNRALAQRYFPGRSAVGQRLAEFGPMGTDAEIVGVVDNARYRSLRDEAAPMIYVAHSQFYMPRMSLVVQTTLPPATMRQALVAAAASIDPDLPLFQIKTMPERLRASLAVERLLAWLLSAFAALAVFLAAAGLYAVVSFTTTLRTREFGIRVALGATARHLRQLVLGQTLWLVGIGLAVGLALALASARALSSLLFGVGPTDVATYLAVGVLLLSVGVAAAQWPARRAARVNPVSALRAD